MKKLAMVISVKGSRFAPQEERIMRLKAGKNGTGKTLASCIYWPDSAKSVSGACNIMKNEADRFGYQVIWNYNPDYN